MTALYDLRDMLCKELEEYGKKGDLSAGTLDIVDKLCHAIKNLDKIIETDGYSGNNDRSYARRRTERYSMEGYSRTGEVVDKLRKLMDEAPDDRTRREIHSLISKMEMM